MSRESVRASDSAQTLSRGLDVLKYLAASSVPVPMTHLAAELGLNRTVVYRLVGALVEHGMARRLEDGRVAIGFGVLELTGNLYPALREAAKPLLESLAEDLGATAHLVVADGSESLAIAVVEPSSTNFHLAYRVGSRHPIDRGAAGRALRAASQGEAGVFFTHGELTPGATGVVASVPVLTGLPVAIGVVTMSGSPWEQFGDRVLAAAADLSDALKGPDSQIAYSP